MKPHLSQSQLDTFCRCPEAWRRRYVENEKIPPGIALLVGSGFHGGVKVNMRQKIDSHADLPAKDIQEAAVTEFETAAAGGYLLDEEEQGRGNAIVIGEAKDLTAALADVHARKQAPEYQPVLVEERIRIELPLARDFLGVIDLADDRDRVIDFKTSGKRKNQQEADSSIQLTAYAAAFRARTGRQPAELRLDTLVKAAKGPYRDVLSTSRDDADLRALGARIDAVSKAIDAGSFPPAPPGAYWCCQKYCGYYDTCRFVSAGKKSLGPTSPSSLA